MGFSLAFILSFISLAFGIGSGVFFFLLWKESSYKNGFLLSSAIGIFLMYLFQVPFILANAGVSFVQTRFNFYFLFAFFANFSGLVLLFWAATKVLGSSGRRRIAVALTAWFVFVCLSILNNWFSYGLLKERLPLLVGAFFIFIPLRLIIFASLIHIWSKKLWQTQKTAFWAGILFQTAVLIHLINYFVSIKKILYYPKNFWFIAIVDDKIILVSGIIASVILVISLFKIFQSQKTLAP